MPSSSPKLRSPGRRPAPLLRARDSGDWPAAPQPWLTVGRYIGGAFSPNPTAFTQEGASNASVKGLEWDTLGGSQLSPHPDPEAQKGGLGGLGTVARGGWCVWGGCRSISDYQANSAPGLGVGAWPFPSPQAVSPHLRGVLCHLRRNKPQPTMHPLCNTLATEAHATCTGRPQQPLQITWLPPSPPGARSWWEGENAGA